MIQRKEGRDRRKEKGGRKKKKGTLKRRKGAGKGHSTEEENETEKMKRKREKREAADERGTSHGSGHATAQPMRSTSFLIPSVHRLSASYTGYREKRPQTHTLATNTYLYVNV